MANPESDITRVPGQKVFDGSFPVFQPTVYVSSKVRKMDASGKIYTTDDWEIDPLLKTVVGGDEGGNDFTDGMVNGLNQRDVDYYNSLPRESVWDDRIFKRLIIGDGPAITIIPGITKGTWFGDYYETPMAAAQAADERHTEDPDAEKTLREAALNRAQQVSDMWQKYLKDLDFSAGHSFIHPYAILKLAGGDGPENNWQNTMVFDHSQRRRFYEIEGDERGGYAKNPTTTALINWGNQDDRGRFPYSYTDFVFCKYWNRIPNNRMITLRRYPMPIPDSVEPANYDVAEEAESITKSDGQVEERVKYRKVTNSNEAFTPIATAVTYFGEGTGNSLKEILKFSAGYNWKEIESDIWMTTSNQNETGQGILGTAGGYFGQGLSSVIQALGILSDLKGDYRIRPTNAVGIGPDPYSNGPYENRIIGPVNVINKIHRRERGLTFTADGLNITFEYVARPIAGVNNKAIMIDLLSNMLTLTAASGTFFGGMHRYRTEKPAVYPMRDTYSVSQLYKGNIFGRNGAVGSLLRNAFSNENVSFVQNMVTNVLQDMLSIAKSFLGIGNEEDKKKAEGRLKETGEQVKGTAGRAVAAHFLKGASIPWLMNARALLTGDPIGDWHLTIGNPLNPIAMIGNLIVENCDYEFSDELGPDDFPISFKAVVHLKHGMGRDRDAITSMFNRGYGRTYSLPDRFVSSADRGTKVDNFTDANDQNKNQVSRWTATQFSGEDYISAKSIRKLSNHGEEYDYGKARKQYVLDLNTLDSRFYDNPVYRAAPWQMRWNL